MAIVFLILVILGLLAAIAYPLLKGSSYQEEDEFSNNPHLQDLLSRKEETYSALKELEFDYGTGKLSEDDYQELHSRYKAKAVSILKEIDGAEKEDSIESQIECAVEELRNGKSSPSSKKAPKSSAVFCQSCGQSNELGDKFCSACGQALKNNSQKRVCSTCGFTLEKDDKFCAGCGEALASIK